MHLKNYLPLIFASLLAACSTPHHDASLVSPQTSGALLKSKAVMRMPLELEYLPPLYRKELNKFLKSDDYYSALVMDLKGVFVGAVTGRTSLKEAEKEAIARCKYQPHGLMKFEDGCTVVAVIYPVDENGKLRNASINRSTVHGIVEMIEKTEEGAFGSLAMFDLGGWHSAWSQPSRERADRLALAGCQREVARITQVYGPDRIHMIDGIDLTCRIIRRVGADVR